MPMRLSGGIMANSVKITIGGVNSKPGSSREYKTGGWRTMLPVVDKEKCIQCFQCITYCPDASIAKAEKGVEINLEYCKGCGICAKECPVKAINMLKEEK